MRQHFEYIRTRSCLLGLENIAKIRAERYSRRCSIETRDLNLRKLLSSVALVLLVLFGLVSYGGGSLVDSGEQKATVSKSSAAYWVESPLALGTKKQIAVAKEAANRCGMKNVSERQYSNGKALLSMGRGNSTNALICTEKWLTAHEQDFDPLLCVE